MAEGGGGLEEGGGGWNRLEERDEIVAEIPLFHPPPPSFHPERGMEGVEGGGDGGDGGGRGWGMEGLSHCSCFDMYKIVFMIIVIASGVSISRSVFTEETLWYLVCVCVCGGGADLLIPGVISCVWGSAV